MTSYSVVLRGKHHYKRNLGSPIKNCLSVSLICLSESVRRGLIPSGCDIDLNTVQATNSHILKNKSNVVRIPSLFTLSGSRSKKYSPKQIIEYMQNWSSTVYLECFKLYM